MKKEFSLINIIKQVRSTIHKYKMLESKDKVVVGVSGGPDSVCLLSILYELKDEFQIELIAAHFEHGLRPGEDEKETDFVRSFVQSLGIPFEYEKAEKDIKDGKGSLEEKARVIRYRFLEKVKNKYNANKIALGHNKNDQAETVIMRLLRGSGLEGLKGIPPVRDKVIIRPIIGLTRDEILYYLNKKGLHYVSDSSNMDITFLRNKIRHKLIPLLKTYQPNVIETLAKTAEILFIEDDFLSSEAEKWVKQNSCIVEEAIILSINTFNRVHPALKNRILRCLIKKKLGHTKKITYDHINKIIEMIERGSPNSEIHLPYGLIAKKRYDLLVLEERKEMADYSYLITGYGRYYLPVIDSWAVVERVDPSSILNGQSKNTVFLDVDSIRFPFIIRNIRQGDKIALNGGHKKIKDIFIDMKIPKEARKMIPILIYMDRPVHIWCINKTDKRFEAKNGSKEIIKISLQLERLPLWKYLYNQHKEDCYVAG